MMTMTAVVYRKSIGASANGSPACGREDHEPSNIRTAISSRDHISVGKPRNVGPTSAGCMIHHARKCALPTNLTRVHPV
jgi:hypothetical protein